MSRFKLVGLTGILALLSVLSLPVNAGYYLKDEGVRWRTADGQPVQGVHKANLLICHDERGCYGVIYAGRGLGAWRQRSPLWDELQRAREQLEASDENRVELDEQVGSQLYQSAEQGYWRAMRDSR